MALSILVIAAFVAAQLTTVIGNGKPGLNDQQTDNTYGLVIGPDKALYFCDTGSHTIRRLDLKTRTTSIVAGTGKKGFSGAGGLATQAEIDEPYELRFDKRGDLFFCDRLNHTIQKVDRKTGILSTIAGNGKAGFSGDGGDAVHAQFDQPHSIAFDREGRLLICDIRNHRVRRIDLKSGKIETYLGNGEKKNPAEGAPLVGSPVFGPRAMDIAKDGRMYLVLREGNAVYELDPKANAYRLLINEGIKGPKGISIAPDGMLYIADTENHLVQRIDPRTRSLVRVAGSGERGDGPDGDPLKAKMNRPHGVFVDQRGNIYIGDSEAHRIRLLPKR